MCYKRVVLNDFTKFTIKHLCWGLFSNKETPTQVFSCEFCEFSKNTFFTEQLRETAFVVLKFFILKDLFWKIQDDVRYEIIPSVRNQLKVFDEIDEVERKHRESREREMLMRVAKVGCDILKVPLENLVFSDGYLKHFELELDHCTKNEVFHQGFLQ